VQRRIPKTLWSWLIFLLTKRARQCKLSDAISRPDEQTNMGEIMRSRLFHFVTCALCALTAALFFSTMNAAAQDQPTIQKDSVQVTAFTLSSYKKDFKVFSWYPD
jgi:hypothetical protein